MCLVNNFTAKLTSIKADPSKLLIIFYKPINLFLRVCSRVCSRVIRLFTRAKQILFSSFGRSACYLPYWLTKEKAQVRRYLAPGLPLVQFFEILKERNINYVILRWFDDLPVVEEGEDIDLLVDDTDLSKIADLFVYFSGTQHFDIYSVSGGQGSSYRDVPYYSPKLAKKMLETRCWHKDIYSVPDEKTYLLSLAYHAVFHKGEQSGFVNNLGDVAESPDHNYSEILQDKAKTLGLSWEVNTFKDLYEYLSDLDWVPETDTQRKLSTHNKWLLELLPKSESNHLHGEMMVFVLRDWVFKHDKLDYIVDKIENIYHLDIMLVQHLNDSQQKEAEANIRGGKWDKGPYAVSGGEPKCIIVCYDYHPDLSVKSKTHPFVKNRHVFVKNIIRDGINARKILFKHTNCIHTADDEIEAWEYIDNVIPEKRKELELCLEQRVDYHKEIYPVIDIYASNRSRSKIELINYHGKRAVKKTFRLGAERFLDREAFVCKKFSGKVHTIPPLLEKGKNYLVMPWYENVLPGLSEQEKVKKIKPFAKDILKTMQAFYEEGYALIGLYPGNIIVTLSNEVIVIDFEFLYRYEQKPLEFTEAYEVAGTPLDFDGDIPKGYLPRGHTYENTWEKLFGPIEQYL